MTRPLTIVVAWAEGRVIGRDGDLPWHHSEDLKHFKAVTMGHALVMGRKCHQSIGRPLPGRRNLVISRNPAYEAPGCEVFDGFDVALEAAYATDPAPCVIGGAQVYALAMPLATRLELTEIHEVHAGDVVFPDVDLTAWRETARRESGPLVFRTLERDAR
mgnify:CR=1 FL=1